MKQIVNEEVFYNFFILNIPLGKFWKTVPILFEVV